MNSKSLLLLYIILIAVISYQSLFAQNKSVSTIQKLAIVITSDNLKPYTYTNENGVIVGSLVNKIHTIFNYADIKHEFKNQPWNRAISSTNTDKNVLIYPLTRVESRENNYKWIIPLQQTTYRLYGVKGKHDYEKVDISNHQHQFICQEGTIQCSILEGFVADDSSIIRFSSIDMSQYIKMLLHGRIDFIVVAEPRLEAYAKSAGIMSSDLIEVKNFSYISTDYLAGNTNVNIEIIEKLQTAYKNLSQIKINSASK